MEENVEEEQALPDVHVVWCRAGPVQTDQHAEHLHATIVKSLGGEMREGRRSDTGRSMSSDVLNEFWDTPAAIPLQHTHT